MRATALFALLLWTQLLGCKKYYNLNYRTGPDLNALRGLPGQPVLVGLYPLSALPEGLTTASCGAFTTHSATRELLKGVLAYDVEPVSFVPNARSVARVPRVRGVRWLMVVPFFEDKCSRQGDAWSLLRVWPTTRSRAVEVRSFEILLPWETRPWRQRGCVDGRASRVSWSVCE